MEPRPGTVPGPFTKPSKLVIAAVTHDNSPAALVHEIYRLRHRVQELESQLPVPPPKDITPRPESAFDPVFQVQRSLSSTSSSNPSAHLPKNFRAAPPALPAGYELSSEPELRYNFFGELFETLTQHPSIYWGQDRTRNVFARQLERSWRCLFVLKKGKRKDELAGFCRIVSDGEGCVFVSFKFYLEKPF
ncbi:hypothetical protein P7C70_g4199, partial [Phenoliferia sp. Uapishka_3]